MKNTPQIRFKGYTDAWVQRKFCDIVKRVSAQSNADNLPKVEFEDIASGEGRLNKDVSNKFDNRRGTLFTSGNILYGKLRPYLENWLFADFDGVALGDFWVFEAVGVAPIFSYYLIQTDKYQEIANLSTGTKMPRSDWSVVSDADFLITPSLAEQAAIGEFFRTQGEGIRLHGRKLEGLRVLKRGWLQQMFPQAGERVPRVRFAGFGGEWREKRLGEVCETYSGGTPSVSEKSYYGGSIPFIRSAEINDGQTELFLTQEGVNNSSAKMVGVGTILYALYGATSGEVGRSKIKGAINQAILAIKPLKGFDDEFIAQWLRKQKDSIVSTFLQGGQGNLSAAIIKDLDFLAPSLPEQAAIGEFFRNLDGQITAQSQKVEQLKRLKAAYLQKMFA